MISQSRIIKIGVVLLLCYCTLQTFFFFLFNYGMAVIFGIRLEIENDTHKSVELVAIQGHGESPRKNQLPMTASMSSYFFSNPYQPIRVRQGKQESMIIYGWDDGYLDSLYIRSEDSDEVYMVSVVIDNERQARIVLTRLDALASDTAKARKYFEDRFFAWFVIRMWLCLGILAFFAIYSLRRRIWGRAVATPAAAK